MGDLEDNTPLSICMRRALDKALRECVWYVMSDKDGHVELVDGDIDTESMAEDVIESLRVAGWLDHLHRDSP